jgi:CubicO group peptidase (beta-lactamase class C family)
VCQAASLTKPVLAFGVLRPVLEGLLSLESPVSRFSDGVYFYNVLARGSNDASDIVPESTLSRITVVSLLNLTVVFPLLV